MTLTGRHKGLNTQTVVINNKDKGFELKYGLKTQVTNFSDYKALNYYR